MQMKAAPPGGPTSLEHLPLFSTKSFGLLCSGPVQAENAGGNPALSQADAQAG